MRGRDVLTLIGCIVFSQLAGIIGSIATTSSVSTWYVTLAKPDFQPPGWLFGPVWLLLYTLIGVALYLVWKEQNVRALEWFIVNWFINMWWSILFFGLHTPLLALVNIILLVGAISGMMNAFYRVNRATLLLLAPYLGWVLFASVLNAAIVMLN